MTQEEFDKDLVDAFIADVYGGVDCPPGLRYLLSYKLRDLINIVRDQTKSEGEQHAD